MKNRFAIGGITLAMFLTVTGCASNLDTFKTAAKAEIENYAEERKDEFDKTNWLIVSFYVEDGKETIEAAKNKPAVNLVIKDIKNTINAVKDGKGVEQVTVDDFRFTVAVNKTDANVGEKIVVFLLLDNLSENDILVEIPDWIASGGGTTLEDVLISVALPIDSLFEWVATSIEVNPRPQVTFQKESVVQQVFEFIVSESIDLEVFSSAFLYTGSEEEPRFSKLVSLINNPLVITIES